MILIGIGSNLASAHGDSRATVAEALRRLDDAPLSLLRRSRSWRTQPVPASDQPWYINAVAEIATALDPARLLAHLHGIEAGFGRLAGARNAARPLDLDIVDYDGMVSPPGAAPILPHPRMELRAFVLRPLAELAPEWRHPATGEELSALLGRLPADQLAEPIDD